VTFLVWFKLLPHLHYRRLFAFFPPYLPSDCLLNVFDGRTWCHTVRASLNAVTWTGRPVRDRNSLPDSHLVNSPPHTPPTGEFPSLTYGTDRHSGCMPFYLHPFTSTSSPTCPGQDWSILRCLAGLCIVTFWDICVRSSPTTTAWFEQPGRTARITTARGCGGHLLQADGRWPTCGGISYSPPRWWNAACLRVTMAGHPIPYLRAPHPTYHGVATPAPRHCRLNVTPRPGVPTTWASSSPTEVSPALSPPPCRRTAGVTPHHHGAVVDSTNTPQHGRTPDRWTFTTDVVPDVHTHTFSLGRWLVWLEPTGCGNCEWLVDRLDSRSSWLGLAACGLHAHCSCSILPRVVLPHLLDTPLRFGHIPFRLHFTHSVRLVYAYGFCTHYGTRFALHGFRMDGSLDLDGWTFWSVVLVSIGSACVVFVLVGSVHLRGWIFVVFGRMDAVASWVGWPCPRWFILYILPMPGSWL